MQGPTSAASRERFWTSRAPESPGNRVSPIWLQDLHEMLKAEGLVGNAKRAYRIYREEKLPVRRKRRKRRPARDWVPMPDRLNQRWSIDFMSDQLATGRCFRILNVVDDYSQECVGQMVDFSISGQRVSRLLDQHHWPTESSRSHCH